jgi:hypothetical protein
MKSITGKHCKEKTIEDMRHINIKQDRGEHYSKFKMIKIRITPLLGHDSILLQMSLAGLIILGNKINFVKNINYLKHNIRCRKMLGKGLPFA